MSNLVISSLKTAAVKPSHGDQDLLLFLPWEHTFHTWAGAFRRRLWTCQLQKEKGPIIIIILSGNRQELGEAPRVSTPESPQRSIHADHFTVLFVETNNFGWQTLGNLYQAPGNTRKSQHSCAPAMGGVGKKSFTRINPSIPSGGSPGWLLASRMHLVQNHHHKSLRTFS